MAMSQSKEDSKRKLCEHYGSDIVFIDMLDQQTEMKKFEDKELPKNAIWVYGCRIGCYDIVITERLYNDDSDHCLSDKISASREDTEEARNEGDEPCGTHSLTEVYAKNFRSEKYKLLCDTDRSMTAYEIILFIGAVKKSSSMPDANSNLIVLKEYVGDYDNTDYWYILKPRGTIKSYRVLSSDDDAQKTEWRLEETLDEATSNDEIAKYHRAEKSKDFRKLTDDELRMYVPDVYQESIFPDDDCHIDFNMLKSNGIKFLSFDIDDTIIGLEQRHTVPQKAKDLFEDLKKDFKVILFSNGSHDRVEFVAKELGIEFIARAGKHDMDAFRKMKIRFGFKVS